ncbi:hypothetical protein TSAR_006355 [Trichomalopsis sarcophagae]|uniref:Uncharacterized protein n=1 Tax=Trichomalopsis sarcophagae TaxID=543379 RepID=A0A232FKQ3_9HYME|nr:hypothetical protein TSAR_006355 [Trichomalopsis sarcophagae]
MDQMFQTVIMSVELDETSGYVTIRFGPPRKLTLVVLLLNKYGPNNTRSFKVTNQGADDATATLTIAYRAITSTTELLQTSEPTNNQESDQYSDILGNSTNSNATDTDNTDSYENSDDFDSMSNTDRTNNDNNDAIDDANNDAPIDNNNDAPRLNDSIHSLGVL